MQYECVMNTRQRGNILLRPRRVWAYSRSRDTLTSTLLHPRRVHLFPSIVQIIINKLQSLETMKTLF